MVIGKINTYKELVVLASCLVLPFALLGEAYRGNVLNANDNQPLEYVNVVALSADSSFVAGTVTDSVGRFSVAGDGVRMLNFKLIGYEEQILTVGNGNQEHLTVRLMPKEAMLKEVEVTARKPQTRLVEGDMLTMVENTVLANMPTVFEALSFIPMMSVQGESVSVFGKGAPVFYINSRQVRSQTELRSLRPSDIISVRIITNPGVRYGSDVNCVVIIKTRKAQGDGFSGWLHEGMGYKGDFSNTVGLFLQYRRDKFEAFTQWFQNHDVNDVKMRHTSYIYTAEPIKEEYSLVMRPKSNDANGKFGFTYDISPDHSVGGYYKLSWGKLKREDYSITERTQNDETETWTQNKFITKRSLPSHEANLYYEGTVGNLSISSNVDYNGYRTTLTSDYLENGSGDSRQFTTATRRGSNLFAENVILTYQAGKAEFTLGQEWTTTNYKTTFDDPEGPIGSSRSENDESTVALFASWKQRIGRFFLEAGVRYEHRRVKYDGNVESYRETRDNLFPVVKFGGTHGEFAWNVGYRYNSFPPSYQALSSDILYVNRFTYQSGNPFLKTSQRQELYLNAQYRSFWLQAGFNFIDNAMWFVSDIYGPNPDIILQHWVNRPKQKSLYANVGYQTQIGCWRPFIAVGINQQYLHIDAGGKRVDLSTPSLLVSTSHAVELPLGFTLYGRYEMHTKEDRSALRQSFRDYLSFGVSKSFFKGALLLQVWGHDLLNHQNPSYTEFAPAVILSGKNDYRTRKLQLFVRYQFNATKSRYKGTGAGAAEKQRL